MKKIKRILSIVLAVAFILPLTSCKWIERWIEEQSNRSYTIRFHANGGTGEMADFFVEKGEDGYLPKCTFTKDGYECLAWSTDENGDRLYGYIPNLTFWLPNSVDDGDTVDLYAFWTTPGFTFTIQGWGLQTGVIKKYEGNAKDVIVPSFTNGHYEHDSISGCGAVTLLGSGIFADHTEIETISNLPIDGIPSKTFAGCTALKTISLRSGKGIHSAGERAFYNCSALQEISFENLISNTVSIGKEAFYGCTSIEKLVIPRPVEELGESAFYGWTENQTIEFLQYSENTFGEDWLKGCSAKIIWSGTKGNE